MKSMKISIVAHKIGILSFESESIVDLAVTALGVQCITREVYAPNIVLDPTHRNTHTP